MTRPSTVQSTVLASRAGPSKGTRLRTGPDACRRSVSRPRPLQDRDPYAVSALDQLSAGVPRSLRALGIPSIPQAGNAALARTLEPAGSCSRSEFGRRSLLQARRCGAGVSRRRAGSGGRGPASDGQRWRTAHGAADVAETGSRQPASTTSQARGCCGAAAISLGSGRAFPATARSPMLPTVRPRNPNFGSGPTAKRPGWSLAGAGRRDARALAPGGRRRRRGCSR